MITHPAADNPATQQYIEHVEAVDGKVALLGAQAWSAWLLFAQSARDCDLEDDLTLLLKTVHRHVGKTQCGDKSPGFRFDRKNQRPNHRESISRQLDTRW